jgi:hypothetical protein
MPPLPEGSQQGTDFNPATQNAANQIIQDQQGGQNNDNPASSGGADIHQIMEKLQASEAQNQELKQSLEGLRGEQKKDSETLSKIRQVFSPDPENQPDPSEGIIQNLEAQMDQYLEAALEAEREGRPIPLTVNTAISNLQHQIQYIKDEQSRNERIAKIEADQKRLSDPNIEMDKKAYSSIDDNLQSVLDHTYGKGYNAVKQAQFEAVSKLIVDEIKDLQQNDPETWFLVRRSPENQKKLVEHFFKQSQPPRVREMIEEDRIKRTPLSMEEKLNAFREAREKAKEDPSYNKIVSEIRREILSDRLSRDFKSGSSNRSTDLF